MGLEINMLRFFTLVILLISGTVAVGQSATSLDYYLGQALQNSPLLKDYRNQVAAGQVDSELIRAGYRPQVTGSSINVWAPTVKGWGYDQAISNGGNFTTVVAVNQTLVGQKHLDAQYESVQLRNQGIGNAAKVSEQDLKKSVTAQYITTYGDLQQLNFNREVYALLQKEEVLLKDLAQKKCVPADGLSRLSRDTQTGRAAAATARYPVPKRSWHAELPVRDRRYRSDHAG